MPPEQIVDFTPSTALAGGVLIGTSAALVLWLNGKLAGISGVVARLFDRVPGDTAWRAWFLVGMVAGGAATFALAPGTAAHAPQAGLGGVLAAGFLVGLGTRLGRGCTSGHGVCGLATGSPRSVAATATFMALGAATVFVARHVFGSAA